ncbi:MAG: arginine--tRNA ligase [Candidatus Shapirobacteria bacterium]
MKIVKDLKEILIKSIKALDINIKEEEIKIEHPSDVSFGDYSTNIAMVLATRLRKSSGGQSPRELAEKIKSNILQNDYIEKIEIAGAGFINFYLETEYLIKEAEVLNYEIEFKNKLSEYGKDKTMVIDYSAPNIAKPFGIGHLRSTNIGQAIYNIYQILGWKCIGDNHIGDWGTQYGKLVAAVKKWNDKKIEDLTIEDLEKLYVKFHKEAESDEKLIDEGRDYFAKLENGDKEAREIWQKCINISFREFDKVYELLGVKIDYIHGESFYEDMLPQITKEIINKKITKKSEGALIVELGDMPPAMLQKSNGTTTYFTRDMATIKYRLDNWKPDLIIYEVGVDQELHFRQVFKTAELMGWMPKLGMVHIAHGLIRWTTGKFSTRKGDTIHLSDVIDKAMEKAKEIAPDNNQEQIKAVAIGAVKFNDLSSDPRRDVIFDWDKIMSLEGDSGPYLQYTYARCLSVLNKTQIKEQKNVDEIQKDVNPDEMALIKEFYRFEEKIIESSTRYSPAVIAEYLLSLARKYNEFYAKNRIIGEKQENFRVFLTHTTASVLKTGLKLLGIETVEKM